MEITLVILAAGMASRYGAMKQTEGFGPGGETIMDYSIYDAIRAGFTKVVFIIRKDFAGPFKEAYDKKLSGKVKVEYVFQELNSFTQGYHILEGRTKPWGTGHAIMCAGSVIDEPFAVINADDFYGREGFEKAAAFLINQCNEKTYAIIGYPLDKTLSDFGTVSRGVCQVDANGKLLAINERTKIFKKNGAILYEDGDKLESLTSKTSVSMNFWCFHPSVFEHAAQLFDTFMKDSLLDLKSEFFIPIIADSFIKERGGNILVIPTEAQWFGVTYKEDAPSVKENLQKLTSDEMYPLALWQ